MGVFSRLWGRAGDSFAKNQLRYKKPHQPWQSFNSQKKFRRNLWLMNGGILLTIFAGCYLVVPMYRSFCQAAGLIGDGMQKDYSKIIKDGKKRRLSII